MVWQAASGFRFQMPEGYLASWLDLEPEYGARFTMDQQSLVVPEPALSELHRQQMLAELSGWHVETVIVGPCPPDSRRRVHQRLCSVLHAPSRRRALDVRFGPAPRCTGGRSTRGTQADE